MQNHERTYYCTPNTGCFIIELNENIINWASFSSVVFVQRIFYQSLFCSLPQWIFTLSMIVSCSWVFDLAWFNASRFVTIKKTVYYLKKCVFFILIDVFKCKL